MPGLRLQRTPVDRTRNIRRVMVHWDETAFGFTAAELVTQLMAGNPRIAVSRAQPQGIELTVFMNDPGDEKIVVRRLKQLFRT
jgi:hypothetical protein